MFFKIFQSCTAMLLGLASGPKIAFPPIHPDSHAKLNTEAITVKSVSASRKDASRVWQLADGDVVYNGTRYSGFKARILPVANIPVFYASPPTVKDAPENQKPVRLIFLPGFGSDLSHSGSLLGVARLFFELAAKEQATVPLARYMAELYPELIRPMEVVALDLPSAGWAPPLDNYPTAFDLAEYIRKVVQEIQSTGEPMTTYIVTRSASSPLAILAAENSAIANGIFLTAGTYPDEKVIAENLEDVTAAADRGEYKLNWNTIHGILNRLAQPEVRSRMRQISRRITDRPVLWGFSGTDDGQTSALARSLWNELLAPETRTIRELLLWSFRTTSGHSEIPGAGHFIFARPPGATDFSAEDSDVTSLKLFLEAIQKFTPVPLDYGGPYIL